MMKTRLKRGMGQLDLAKNIFIFSCMAIVSAALSFSAWAQFALSGMEVLTVSIGVLVVQLTGYLLVWKSLIYNSLKNKIDNLTLVEADNAHGVNRLTNEVQGLRKSLKSAARSESEPLVRELEVIGSLVKQLAENFAETEGRIVMLEARPIAETRPPTVMPRDKKSSKTKRRSSNPRILDFAEDADEIDEFEAGEEEAPQQRTRKRASRDHHSYEPDLDESKMPPKRTRAARDEEEEPRYAVLDFDEPEDENGAWFGEPVAPKKHKRTSSKALDEPSLDVDRSILRAVRSAVDRNKVDLYLQPIVKLPQRKPMFYEAFSRIRTEGGDLIRPAQYLRSAENLGAMPILDKMLLVRAIQVLRRLLSRKADAVVVCNISAHSIADNDFFNDFRKLLLAKSDLSEHMIFEFDQETVESLGAIEEESLRSLKSLGFHFAVDNVTNLSMDFNRLLELGFHYVKVSADVLLSSKHDGFNDIHPADIPRYLARNGLQLIVDHIENENQVVELLDFDVTLGQGFLFAAPREVKPDVKSGSSARTVKSRLAS